MTQPHERHNIVTTQFIRSLATEGVTEDGVPGIMVALESLMLAVMRINVKAFGLPPQQSAEVVEMAYQRALEQFTEDNK